MQKAFMIAGRTIQPGVKTLIDLPMPKLSSRTEMSMPVHVIHGRKPGPRLFICAAVHGDELNGIEIIRRLLNQKGLSRLHGTLVAVPAVNVYGLIHESRYLPDRRDLNRSFPGSQKGSLAARLAYLFMNEIVGHCSHGIDIHTGAIHRTNLPQIRANLDDPETERLARAFGAPVIINASVRDGSLRGAAAGLGIPILLYEAGQALRFDEISIRAGMKGIMNVMRSLEMLPASRSRRNKLPPEPFVARSSSWTRAPDSGLLRTTVALGASVNKGEALAFIDDPYSGVSREVKAHASGIVIGRTEIPLVHEGEALFHIARFRSDDDEVADHVESFHQDHIEEGMLDEEPTIV